MAAQIRSSGCLSSGGECSLTKVERWAENLHSPRKAASFRLEREKIMLTRKQSLIFNITLRQSNFGDYTRSVPNKSNTKLNESICTALNT